MRCPRKVLASLFLSAALGLMSANDGWRNNKEETWANSIPGPKFPF